MRFRKIKDKNEVLIFVVVLEEYRREKNENKNQIKMKRQLIYIILFDAIGLLIIFWYLHSIH